MAPLTVQAIDQFIGQGNPLAQAGGAQTLLRATGGNLAGAAFLAALARKESEFGRTAGKFKNNFWGWGVHLSPSVHTSPSVEEGARKVWTGLSSGLYKGAGLVTPGAIINRYAPPSENNTDLYKTQVGQWFTQLGLSPQTNIFSGATVPVPASGGAQARPAGARAPAAEGFTPQGQITLTPRTQKAVRNYIVRSERDVLAGRAPGDITGIVGLIQRDKQRSFRAAPAPAQDAHAGHDHGAGTPVSGGRATAATAPGGGWGGSEAPALAIAKISGLPVTSQKRDRQMTASGGVSDHWTGSTNSYAVDLGTSGAAGDRAFKKIMAALGQPNLKPGQWHNININGYRYQVGWRTAGHYDHIHVGVKKL